jgi:tetratricopeptide (TPR) repeat protein
MATQQAMELDPSKQLASINIFSMRYLLHSVGQSKSDEDYKLIGHLFATLEAHSPLASYLNSCLAGERNDKLVEIICECVIEEVETHNGAARSESFLSQYLSTLALHLERQHKFEQAAAIRLKLLTVKQHIAEVDTATTRITIAIDQVNAGKLADAQNTFEQAIPVLSRNAGAASNSTNNLYQLCDALLAVKEVSQADRCFRIGAAIEAQSTRIGQPNLFGGDYVLAHILEGCEANGRDDQAISLLNYLIEMYETAKPSKTIEWRLDLAKLYLTARQAACLAAQQSDLSTKSKNVFDQAMTLYDKLAITNTHTEESKTVAIEDRIEQLKNLGLNKDADDLTQMLNPSSSTHSEPTSR